MTAAQIARALARYLAGTDRRVPDLDALASAHAGLPRDLPPDARPLAEAAWEPPVESLWLRSELVRALDAEEILDLVVYGSQARRSTTGFSDVDAVLVVADAAVEDPRRLRALRPRVLAAQRAVLQHQPMQHHGFDVVTPALLGRAGASLPLPEVALTVARSLYGRAPRASFAGAPDARERIRRFHALSGSALAASAWPSHPMEAHRLVSTFELVPALFLQARGRDVAKWDSFDEARRELGDWAYDELRDVRERWPRPRRPLLEAAARATRNPWVAVAAWRRLPARLPRAVESLLSPALLERLQADVRAMQERVR